MSSALDTARDNFDMLRSVYEEKSELFTKISEGMETINKSSKLYR